MFSQGARVKSRWVLASVTGCAVALSLFAAGARAATADEGWYLGAGVGRSHFVDNGDRIDDALANQGLVTASSMKHDDTSYALTVGYRLNTYFAVEGGYLDLGKFKFDSDVSSPAADSLSGSFKSSGMQVRGVGIVPLDAGFSMTGRLGLTRLRTTLDAASATGAVTAGDESHTDAGWTYGLGIGYDVNRNVATELGWNRYQRVGDASTTGRSAVDDYMLDVKYRF
jgi:OOP family OmpA-OmpF porin